MSPMTGYTYSVRDFEKMKLFLEPRTTSQIVANASPYLPVNASDSAASEPSRRPTIKNQNRKLL
jgi:hypothetical protein